MTDKDLSNSRLLFSLVLLKLRFSEKIKFIVLSIVIGIVVSSVYMILPEKPSMFGINGLVRDVQSLVTIFFPFLFASLVAVAGHPH